jgi:hypothetical protein
MPSLYVAAAQMPSTDRPALQYRGHGVNELFKATSSQHATSPDVLRLGSPQQKAQVSGSTNVAPLFIRAYKTSVYVSRREVRHLVERGMRSITPERRSDT